LDTGALRSAFSSLGASLEWRGPDDRRATLRLVMALNQEIGKLARGWPETEAEAKELQTRVNLLTLAAKAGDRDRALRALEEAKQALHALCSRAEKPPSG